MLKFFVNFSTYIELIFKIMPLKGYQSVCFYIKIAVMMDNYYINLQKFKIFVIQVKNLKV